MRQRVGTIQKVVDLALIEYQKIYFYVELIFSYIFYMKLARHYVKTSTANRPSYELVTR